MRRLRQLVSVLLVVMILGIVTVVGLLAWRMMGLQAAPVLPNALQLPDGHVLQEASVGTRWITLIAQDPNGQIWVHVADRSGTLQASAPVSAE